ncbi:MAG: rhomboid family intramembrane serine protease [Rhodocyclaceae bacterium]|nr:rhomboid family intramembrane serine protease [Rhodocyclaceae bacterium]
MLVPFPLSATSTYVTRVLVGLNVLAFLGLAVAAGNWSHIPSAVLIDWGGNDGVLTLNGEAWRLLSSVFLHGGLLHIGLNMLALYQAGNLVERMFGPLRFALLYLASGLLASLVSVWWRQDVVSVGASGAIFGVFGGLLSYLIVHRRQMPRAAYARLKTMTLSFVGYSLLIGFAIPGVDNAAHVGGLLGGLAAGWLLSIGPARPSAGMAGSVALLALAVFAWHDIERPARPNPAVAVFAARQPLLAERQRQLVEDLGAGRIAERDAVRIIDTELKPNWDALIAAMAAQSATGNPEARQLFAYAQLERAALEALELGLRTGHPTWLETAARLRLEANRALQGFSHTQVPR